MKKQQQEPACSKAVIEMLAVATEYCIFMENKEKYTSHNIYSFLQKLLPLMYLKGALLPDIQVDFPEANERFVTEEQWEMHFAELRNKFGTQDEFWYLDPQSPDPIDPVKGSLAENLADIYQDMKDFMLLYQVNSKAARQNAAAECKALFSQHWGIKIIYVLKNIHILLQKQSPVGYFEDFFL